MRHTGATPAALSNLLTNSKYTAHNTVGPPHQFHVTFTIPLRWDVPFSSSTYFFFFNKK